MTESGSPGGVDFPFEAIAPVLESAEGLSPEELLLAAGALWQRAQDLKKLSAIIFR